jgi:Leucine-rich repeat (LRR) protein
MKYIKLFEDFNNDTTEQDKILEYIKTDQIELALTLIESLGYEDYFYDLYKNVFAMYGNKIKTLKHLFSLKSYLGIETDENIFDVLIFTLPKLKHFRLIKKVDFEFPNFTIHLDVINLNGCNILEIPENFSATNLNNIAMCGCNLKQIPDFVFDCQDLKVLDVSYNKIEKIDNQIQKLKKLTNLNISNNPIKRLPNLDRLSKLDDFNYKNTNIDIEYEKQNSEMFSKLVQKNYDAEIAADISFRNIIFNNK